MTIQILPPNDINFSKDDFLDIFNNDNGLKSSLELIKCQMKKYLLNYEALRKEILIRVR